MKGIVLCIVCLCFAAVMVTTQVKAADSGKKSGEALFKENCSPCHPDGGNIINPQKTLHKKDRDANNIRKAGDIMKKMRNPGPGMTKFDKKTMPDSDAKKIADYILKTFK